MCRTHNQLGGAWAPDSLHVRPADEDEDVMDADDVDSEPDNDSNGNGRDNGDVYVGGRDIQ